MTNIPEHVRRGAQRRAEEPPSEDSLDRVRRAAARLRELYTRKADLSEQAASVQAEITHMETRELVDVLAAAKMPKFDLEADGNYPAAHFEKKPFYSAKIPEEREQEALTWLEAEGHGDLIKTEFRLSFGMGDHARAQKLEASLVKDGYDFSKKVGVAASTLTAFVRRETEKNHVVPADLLGAFVGEVVKVKFSAGAPAADTRGDE